jgi:signal recognition particle subunit SRP54
MGDVVSFVEKAQETMDRQVAEKLEEKFRKSHFNLDDFLLQIKQIRSMGPITQIMEMIPGMAKLKHSDLSIDEKQIIRLEAIIKSMTKAERMDPHIINGGRRKRIAMGSGTTVVEVNRLLKQFQQMEKMMRQFGKNRRGKKFPAFPMGLG